MSTETKEGVCINCPACGNQYEKDNDELYFKDVVRFKRKAKKAKSQLAQLTRENEILKDACRKSMNAIGGYKSVNRLAEDSVLNKALIACCAALAMGKEKE